MINNSSVNISLLEHLNMLLEILRRAYAFLNKSTDHAPKCVSCGSTLLVNVTA